MYTFSILSTSYLSVYQICILCVPQVCKTLSVFTQCVYTHVLKDAHHCKISTLDTAFVISLMVDLKHCCVSKANECCTTLYVVLHTFSLISPSENPNS